MLSVIYKVIGNVSSIPFRASTRSYIFSAVNSTLEQGIACEYALTMRLSIP